MARPSNSRFFSVLLLTFFLCASSAAQSEPPAKPAPQQEPAPKEEPTVVSAAALILGAKMEESATPEFLKWSRSYAKKELLGRSVPPEEAIRKLFEERYPKASPQARAAAAFLLWHQAYEQGRYSQEIAQKRVDELDRDIGFLEDDLRRAENTPILTGSSPSRMEVESRILARLQSTEQQRKLHASTLEQIGERVDVCLQRLGALYDGVKDSDPELIRSLK